MTEHDDTRPELLRWQFRLARSLLELRLADLTSEACLWIPAEPCWTVRPDSEGRWVPDWADPEPDPPMTASIGWLTWHIGWWLATSLDHLEGAGTLRREDLFWPGDVDATRRWLDVLLGRWSARLDAWTDLNLEVPGPGWPWPEPRPLGYLVAWVNAELMKNAAEVGQLRDLEELTRGHQDG